MGLATDEAIWSYDLNTALQKVTETTSKALKVARVSIWNTNVNGALFCLDLYEQQNSSHSHGIELNRGDFPRYFESLDVGRIIDANDAHVDSRTSEFSQSYLKPLGICSMLDATLRAAGKVFGVLCIEHIGDARVWSEQEKNAALTLSELVSQIFVYHDLKKQAAHDHLTNLPNRTSLRIELKNLLDNYYKNRTEFCLLLIDLDRFKEVNDTLGHDYGDRLLCTIAPRIKEILHNENAFLSRLGGDEFALLVRNKSDPASLRKIAQLVIDAISTPFVIDEIVLEIGASIGIVPNTLEILDEQEMLRCADVAMYHAKRTGVDYAFYSSEIDTHSKEKLSLMADLRSAIFEEQFVLHYQPKIALASNKLVGFEALVRWQHPDKGIIYPDKFIELVEMSNLIHPFTEQVLKTAIKQIKKWNLSKIGLRVAVNISARNLLEHNFPGKIQNLLSVSGIDPSLLELEITENALITDPVRTLGIISKISSMGVKLTIDDFGTGYSSLNYLKQLSINTLKIDRSFVIEMDTSMHDEVIVRSTISLAHNLGLEVVAEGVETERAMQILSDMNCDFVQGYYISYPLPPDEAEVYLNKND